MAAVSVLSGAIAIGGTTGSLLGTARDGDGKPLEGVRVSVSSPSLPAGAKSTTSDAKGFYSFLVLPPGEYRVVAEHPAFPAAQQEGLVVRVDSSLAFDPVLGLPELRLGVKVLGERSVDPKQVETVTTLDEATLENVPTIGRHYASYLALAPGVVSQGGYSGSPREFNVHGARAVANQWYLDGGDTSDTGRNPLTRFTVGNRFAGGWRAYFNPDAIERMDIVTAAYRAEHGRSDGAVVNMISKSGSDLFEGTFRFDIRDDAWDKRGSGKRQYEEADFYRRYYSATLGGPIVRDRAWFFVSALIEDEARVSYLPGTPYPVISSPSLQRDLFLKVNYEVSDEHQLRVSFHQEPFERHNLDPTHHESVPSARGAQTLTGNYFQLQETAILSPTLLLESQLYVIDDRKSTFGPDPDAPAPDTPWSGTDAGTGLRVGEYTQYTEVTSDRLQLKEDLSLYVGDASGTHDLKTGIDVQIEGSETLERIDPFYTSRNGVPFKKLYYLDDPRATGTFEADSRSFAAYVQDAWSPRPGWTLQLGLRADHQSMEITGLSGQERFFDPGFGPEDVQARRDTIAAWGIAPRAGVAWDIGGRGQHVARASIGRYYELLPGFLGDAEHALRPFVICNTDAQGNCLQEPGKPGVIVNFVDRDLELPYTDEITVGYERELGGEMTAGVTAIHRQSRRLLQTMEVNTRYSDADGDGFPETTSPINPNFTYTNFVRNHDRSTYDGLELTLGKRLSHRWQLLASYTFSLARGDAPYVGAEPDLRATSSRSRWLDYDQRHVAKLDATYVVPGDVHLTGSARYWSGVPYSVSVDNYLDENGNGIYDLGESLVTGTHDVGEKNGRRNPDAFNLDVRIDKEFRIKSVTLGLFANVSDALNSQPVNYTSARVLPYDESCDPTKQTCHAPGEIVETESKSFGRMFQLGFSLRFGGRGGNRDTEAAAATRNSSTP